MARVDQIRAIHWTVCSWILDIVKLQPRFHIFRQTAPARIMNGQRFAHNRVGRQLCDGSQTLAETSAAMGTERNNGFA